MNTNLYKFIGAGSVLIGASACQSIVTAPSEKPNILLIMVDDLGYNDLSIQKSSEIVTPNIDSIAQNGVRFSNAYVTASVCSPSRAGMITGRYQQRFGHESNCPPHKFGMNVKYDGKHKLPLKR